MDSMVFQTVCKISSKPSTNIVHKMKDENEDAEEIGDNEPRSVDS